MKASHPRTKRPAVEASRRGGKPSSAESKAAEPKLQHAEAEARRPGAPFPIVGIGASAGGLEAMNALLKHLPAHTGMAFVLVQHLDPTHESALTTILARATKMPVVEAKNNLRLEADQLHIIPPNNLIEISARRLKLSPRDTSEGERAVDYFLHSLAEEEGSRSIGVILSGNGSDGTQGLLAVKAAGGITFAQEERTAKYPAMPGSAITAGCVDFVLPPERIAQELARIAGHPFVSPEAGALPAEPERTVAEKAFDEIVAVLRQRTTVDFAQYKHATLERRIQRRMVLHRFDSLKDYAAYLRSHAAEVKELYNDILIHVTGFFRDAHAFQTLKKKVFPRLLKKKPADEAVRVWVPGCSSGEEAYSLAITLIELLAERKAHNPVQVFATDINDAALDKARAGVYPESIKSDVSPDRLRRFFARTDGGYRINKSVREMCIFARQNVAADPPFSNIDLISCRNLLIYLAAPLQRKVLPTFHYALRPNGYLMLGASETIGGYAELFTLADKKIKLYSKKHTEIRPAVAFGHGLPEPQVPTGEKPALVQPAGPNLADVQRQADRITLANFSPAGVIINRHMEVLQFRGHTGPYLEHAHGEASLNLLKMAREGLMLDLRTLVAKAIKQNARARQEGIRFKQDGATMLLHIEAIPFSAPPSTEKFFLVLFEAGGPAAPVKPAVKARGRSAHEDAELNRVREELVATRESLQAIIEEQEATNEELRSANEEIMSSNEELQSTNEELETAKEELQSTNEELTTLNDELESRNTELEHVNNDLHNLLSSVNLPILMLGHDLRIRRFTSMAEKMFNLIPSDLGRPITDIRLPVEIQNLNKIVLEVIDSLATRDLELQDNRKHWWSVRIRPYKTTDNKIDGAVMVLVDIDMMKSSMDKINDGRLLAEGIVNTVNEPLLVLDPQLAVLSANEAFYRTFHLTPKETINSRVYNLGDGQWDNPKLRTLLEEILPRDSHFDGFEVEFNLPAGPARMLLNARRLICDEKKTRMILLAIQEAK